MKEYVVWLNFLFGIIFGIILWEAVFSENKPSQLNGTFVKNGTDEFYWLQYKEYNRRQITEKYDLEQVIIGNFCGKKYERGHISEITQQSFRLQCCLNFTSCENYVIVNKKLKEVSIR